MAILKTLAQEIPGVFDSKLPNLVKTVQYGEDHNTLILEFEWLRVTYVRRLSSWSVALDVLVQRRDWSAPSDGPVKWHDPVPLVYSADPDASVFRFWEQCTCLMDNRNREKQNAVREHALEALKEVALTGHWPSDD